MRRALLSCGVIFFALALLFASPSFAFAAAKGATSSDLTHKSAAPASPLTAYDCIDTPSDELCNGYDPNPVCAQSVGQPYTVADIQLTVKKLTGDTTSDVANDIGGEIQLRYSPICQTNWSRVYSYTSIWSGTEQMWYNFYVNDVQVVRADGQLEHSTPASGTTETWSPMVYAPVQKAKACARFYWSETYANNPNGGGGGWTPNWLCTALY